MNAKAASSHRIGRLVLGLVSGFLLGLGLVGLLVAYGTVALGTKAPLVVLAVVVVLGIAVGAIPKRQRAHRSIA